MLNFELRNRHNEDHYFAILYFSTGGGGCNTDISGLYNTNILTAITPGTLKFSMPKIFALSRDRVVL